MTAPAETQRTHMPGVDAMRGLIALIGMFFHANIVVFKTGFFFVDTFGILSAYLITSILLVEFERKGRINFKNFYLRRARRLLPAMFLALVLVVIGTGILYPDALHDLRGQVLAVLGYGYNWYAIVTGVSYFTQFTLMPLQHLWTLSLEEQFYLIWPVLLVLLLVKFRLKLKTVAWVILALAGASLAYSYVVYAGFGRDLYTSTISFAGRDVNRLLYYYMGTFTRAGSFLIGGALAILWRPEKMKPLSGRQIRLVDALGVLSLAALIVLTNAQWFVTDYHRLAMAYLTPVVWITGSLLIMALTRSDTRAVNAILVHKPLIRFGQLSYFLYLLHWAVYQFIREFPNKAVTYPQLLVSSVFMITAAEISMRTFEAPIREKGFTWWLGAMKKPVRYAVVAVMAVGTLTAAGMLVTAKPSAGDLESSLGTIEPIAENSVSKTLGVGDSVMRLSYRQLAEAGVAVDVVFNRSMNEALETAGYLIENGKVTETVILHAGHDDIITKDELRGFLARTEGLERVVLVTLHRYDWDKMEANNEAIRAMLDEFPNVVVADWNTVAVANSEMYLLGDGIHTTPAGSKAYAELLLKAMRAQPGSLVTP
jgi:peptidoglycan/LPS O-acetylase OafA/YrhL